VADPDVTQGEAGTEQTTANATEGQTAGQSVAPTQTTNGTEGGGESFYDYESIRGKPELEAQYKDMQRAFTKKTQAFSEGKDKIAQYDQFMANPVDSLRMLAQQNGYQLVQGQPEHDGKPKTYNNWDEVRDDFKESIRAEVMQELQPMFGELQGLKKQNVEQALNNSHPDWRTYEDEMMVTLQAHPTLVNDPDTLYRMSVPEEVLEARANKRALQKIQGTTEGKVQGQSTTTQQPTKTHGKLTFDEAVAHARQEVRRQGHAPPRE
jgi:hypothetical protein